MGKYYRTPDFNFVRPEEFLFKPPWEELKEGLRYQQKQKDEAIDKIDRNLEALYSIDIDESNPIEKKRFENIVEQYKNFADKATSDISKNPIEYQRYLTGIRQMSNKLKQDVLKGDLHYMAKRKKDLEEFTKTYRGKIDPTIFNKELEYRRNQINQALLNGDYSAEFSQDAVYDRKDVAKDFIGYLKAKNPNIKSINYIKETGKFLIQGSGIREEVTKEEIDNMFKAFVNTGDYKNYFSRLDEIGENKYLDEDGNLDFSSPGLSSTLDFAKSFAYTNEKVGQNANYSLSYQNSMQLAMEKERAKIQAQYSNKSSGGSGSSGGFANTDDMTMDRNVKFNISKTDSVRVKTSIINDYFHAINNSNLTDTEKKTLRDELRKLISPKNYNTKGEFEKDYRNFALNTKPQDLANYSLAAAKLLASNKVDIGRVFNINNAKLNALNSKDGFASYTTNKNFIGGVTGFDSGIIKSKEKEFRETYSNINEIVNEKVAVYDDSGKFVYAGPLSQLKFKDKDGTTVKAFDKQEIKNDKTQTTKYEYVKSLDFQPHIKGGFMVGDILAPASAELEDKFNYVIPSSYKGKKYNIVISK